MRTNLIEDVVFHPRGWEDFTYWATADKKLLRRLLRLIEEARRTPFEGTGKPESLRRNMGGFWSRRIDDEHRLVYAATETELIIIQARYHYGD
jgi:toxin YoeB